MPYQAIFQQIGNTLDLPSTVPLRQGQIVRVGDVTGVVVRALPQEFIDTGRKAAWRIDGVWTLPKKADDVVAGCVPIWWDEDNGVVSLQDDTDMIPFGYATPEGAAAGAVTVNVLLVPGAKLE